MARLRSAASGPDKAPGAPPPLPSVRLPALEDRSLPSTICLLLNEQGMLSRRASSQKWPGGGAAPASLAWEGPWWEVLAFRGATQAVERSWGLGKGEG